MPKIDSLQFEMQAFDIFVFTETLVSASISDSDMRSVHLKDSRRCDRNIRAGVLAIYVNKR